MNWLSVDFPYLVQYASSSLTTSLVVMGDANSTLWFDPTDSGGYVARFGQMATLVHDVAGSVFRLTRLDGSFTEFSDFTQNVDPQGLFRRFVDAAGNQILVTAYSSGEITQVQRTDNSTGVPLMQVCTYEYGDDPDDGGNGRIINILLQSGPAAGPLNNVFQVAYTYYENSPYGGFDIDYDGFLETVEQLSWSNGSWQSLGITYYRYYDGVIPGGYLSALQYVLHPAAFCQHGRARDTIPTRRPRPNYRSSPITHLRTTIRSA